MEYHPKFKKRIQQTAQAAKWSLFHTGMFLDGITTLNWAGIQIYGGYKRFRPESITAYCIGLKLIDPKHEGEIWCGLKTFTEVLWYMWSSISRWSMRVLHLGYSSEALWATVKVNWFSENPQQQKTKAAIWSLNHMEMFSEWHYNTDMSWHWKIWRKTKAFTCNRHCFS